MSNEWFERVKQWRWASFLSWSFATVNTFPLFLHYIALRWIVNKFPNSVALYNPRSHNPHTMGKKRAQRKTIGRNTVAALYFSVLNFINNLRKLLLSIVKLKVFYCDSEVLLPVKMFWSFIWKGKQSEIDISVHPFDRMDFLNVFYDEKMGK